MGYSVYLKSNGETYKLPVNPEEIKKTKKMNIEKYQVLGTGQVSLPAYRELAQYSFECELPHQVMHYMERGTRADPDYYIDMLKQVQDDMEPIRLIYSNNITEDESVEVLLESMEIVEKAGEEGDKYLTLSFLEFRAPSKKYMAVVTPEAVVKQPEEPQPANPAVTPNKTYTVKKGDSLWKLAKQFYGNGAQYPKLFQANSGQIKNPNLIYPGQVLTIPA